MLSSELKHSEWCWRLLSSLLVFFVSGCKGCQYCSIHSVPLIVIIFLIILMFVEFLITKFYHSCNARTWFNPMYDAFVALRLVNDFLDQVFVWQVASPLHWLAILWWALQTQTEWVIFEPVRTHHLGLKTRNFENPIFTFGCFSLKAIYNSSKLQRLLQASKFLFMYSFTHTSFSSGTYLPKLSFW